MKFYSKEEDNVILEAIRTNPSNLQNAFKEAGRKLGRDSHGVSQRWYGSLKKLPQSQFILTSISGSKSNTKNTPVKEIKGCIEVDNGRINYRGFIIEGNFKINL